MGHVWFVCVWLCVIGWSFALWFMSKKKVKGLKKTSRRWIPLRALCPCRPLCLLRWGKKWTWIRHQKASCQCKSLLCMVDAFVGNKRKEKSDVWLVTKNWKQETENAYHCVFKEHFLSSNVMWVWWWMNEKKHWKQVKKVFEAWETQNKLCMLVYVKKAW